MADSKVTDLTALATIADEDLLYVVDDPSVTPLSKKITFGNIRKGIGTLGVQDANSNELLAFTATASAVNHLSITNVATGDDPILTSDGDDTGVGLILRPKDAAGNVLVETHAGATVATFFGADGGAKTRIQGKLEINSNNFFIDAATVYSQSLWMNFHNGSTSNRGHIFSAAADSGTVNTLIMLPEADDASGDEILTALAGVVDQSGTAGYTALLYNVTETATGSGTNNLFDLQVGGVSQFSVANDGSTSIGKTPEGTATFEVHGGDEACAHFYESGDTANYVSIDKNSAIKFGTGDFFIKSANASGSLTFQTQNGSKLQINNTGFGFFGATPVGQASAYTRNATVVEDRTLLASASATATNNNNVLAAIIADLQAFGLVA